MSLYEYLSNPLVGLAIGIVLAVVAVVKKDWGISPTVALLFVGFAFFLVPAMNSLNDWRMKVAACMVFGAAFFALCAWLWPTVPAEVRKDATSPTPPPEPDLARKEGTLVPLNVPTEIYRSRVQGDDWLVIEAAGTQVGINPASTFPASIISVDGESLVTLDNDPKEGKLKVSAVIYGSEGRVIATLNENRFQPVGPAVMDRPDKGTLIVRDDLNVERFRIRFLDPRTISIEGIFKSKGKTEVKIRDGFISGGGSAKMFVSMGTKLAVLRPGASAFTFTENSAGW